MSEIFVYFPNTLNWTKNGYLNGFIDQDEKGTNYYITSNQCITKSDGNIAICNEKVKDTSTPIHINTKSSKITINNDCHAEKSKYTCISYNYETFKEADSELLTITCPQIGKLIKEISVVKNSEKLNENHIIVNLLCHIMLILKFLGKIEFLASYSTFFMNILYNLLQIKWILHNLIENGSFKLRVINVIISKLFDIILGLIIIFLLKKYENFLILWIYSSAMNVVEGLKQVLNTLIDSPAGLKLNFALNKTFAVFFFYHISLWRAFITIIKPILHFFLAYIKFFGIFGASFQFAFLADLITFLTFHVYCIYVYAARFFGIQIWSLISLWRLFIGRKYNPLRERIDSFQYSHNQLFIGTLGFTILLFLLPTTFLYYAVFTSFRLVLIIFDAILIKFIRIIQSLPLYVTILWIIRSPRTKGAIYFELKNEGTLLLHLDVELRNLPLSSCIASNSPPDVAPLHKIAWCTLPSMIFRGQLL